MDCLMSRIYHVSGWLQSFFLLTEIRTFISHYSSVLLIQLFSAIFLLPFLYLYIRLSIFAWIYLILFLITCLVKSTYWTFVFISFSTSQWLEYNSRLTELLLGCQYNPMDGFQQSHVFWNLLFFFNVKWPKNSVIIWKKLYKN